MAKDAQGFDPDEDYTQEDNPFWDCTDAAHPAWWRGDKYGSEQSCKIIKQVLDGDRDNWNFSNAPEMKAICQEIYELMKFKFDAEMAERKKNALACSDVLIAE